MRTKLFSLIVVSPANPRIWKIHISWQAVAVLVLVFVMSFFLSVLITNVKFADEKLSDDAHVRLQSENQALQIENKNAEVRTRKLDDEISRLEEISRRIDTLVHTD